MGSCFIAQEASLEPCDDLEGWEGGKEAQEERVLLEIMTDLHCCISETSTAL